MSVERWQIEALRVLAKHAESETADRWAATLTPDADWVCAARNVTTAQFVGACNPSLVLALLDEIDSLQRGLA